GDHDVDDVGLEAVELTAEARARQAEEQLRVPGPERHGRHAHDAVPRVRLGRLVRGEDERLVAQERHLLERARQPGDDPVDLRQERLGEERYAHASAPGPKVLLAVSADGDGLAALGELRVAGLVLPRPRARAG